MPTLTDRLDALSAPTYGGISLSTQRWINKQRFIKGSFCPSVPLSLQRGSPWISLAWRHTDSIDLGVVGAGMYYYVYGFAFYQQAKHRVVSAFR